VIAADDGGQFGTVSEVGIKARKEKEDTALQDELFPTLLS